MSIAIQFRVLPIQKQLPDEGFETLVDPEDKTASPFGWLRTSANGVDATSSQGNNAAAFVGNAATQASAADSFVFQDDQKLDPRDATNPNAAITNAFYLTNTIHDISYLYGFTEKAFNFQQTQTAAGGLGNDRVLVSVQDASGVNNANFASPPDGQSGQMRMFLWNLANPLRDGALENDIVVHEFTHGITNRMTG
jgi:extracellular elastinolytic metalloproteinase